MNPETDERRGRISMSRLDRVSECAGSVNAERDIPEPPSSDVASMGTRCHEGMETQSFQCLANDDERKAVEIAMELEASVVGAWLEEVAPDANVADCTIIREERLWGLDDRVSGKADLVIIYGEHSLVIDYKFGRGEVAEAMGNLQLRGLAVLVKEANPELHSVTVAIIQPWVSPQTSVCHYALEDLVIARDHVERILDESENPDALRRPSAKACQYCKAAATCPEAQATALALVQDDPAQLPAERLPDLLELAAVAEKALAKRIVAIKARARELIEANPNAIDGWELKDGRTTRTVGEAGPAFEALANAGLIDAKGMLAATKVSLPTLEKQVAQFAELKSKDAKAQVADVLGDQIETKTGTQMLAKKK